MNYLIGHLVGDFIFQNDWMTMNKKKSWYHCMVHCFIYSICVAIFTGWWDYRFTLVFMSHIVFDKTNLVYDWMDWFGSFKYLRKTKEIYHEYDTETSIKTGKATAKTIETEVNAPLKDWIWTYAVVDNTAHLVLLWLIAKI